MTRPEIQKLDKIIERVERLSKETDDSVARQQLKDVTNALLTIYGSAKRDGQAAERA